jgi:hypothetical protein
MIIGSLISVKLVVQGRLVKKNGGVCGQSQPKQDSENTEANDFM